MGCRIIVGNQESREGVECAVLFDSTTGVAFGPVMGSQEEAEKFCAWIDGDPRNYNSSDLMQKHVEFVQQFVCECGTVRDDSCEYCADGAPLADGVHHLEDGATEECLADPAPAAGERFECSWCKRKREQKARKVLK